MSTQWKRIFRCHLFVLKCVRYTDINMSARFQTPPIDSLYSLMVLGHFILTCFFRTLSQSIALGSEWLEHTWTHLLSCHFKMVKPELASHLNKALPLPCLTSSLSLGKGHPFRRLALMVAVAKNPFSSSLMKTNYHRTTCNSGDLEEFHKGEEHHIRLYTSPNLYWLLYT